MAAVHRTWARRPIILGATPKPGHSQSDGLVRNPFDFSGGPSICFMSAGSAPDDAGKGDSGGAGEHSVGELEKLLTTQREENAVLKRSVENRTEESQRLHSKYDTLVTDIGGEEGVKGYREWLANQATAEEERLRQEGEFDKLLATERNQRTKAEESLATERGERFLERVDRELTDAAVVLEAVNPLQVRGLYRGDFVKNAEGNLVHRSETDSETGKPLTPKTFLELARSGNGANLFRSTLNGGSGAGPGQSGSGDGTATPVKIRMSAGQVIADDQPLYEKAVADGKSATIEFVHG